MTNIINAPIAQKDLISAMQGCEQTVGVSVLRHGIMVRRAYLTLVDVISGRRSAPQGWRIPNWAMNKTILHQQMPPEVVATYQVYHDCGKPFVQIVDTDGRTHFPDHAAASERMWLKAGGDVEVGRLIRMDMDAHLLKGGQIADFASRPQAATLLLTALAEVHANAEMFGGLNSDSFKIKIKHLDKRGRQVVAMINASAN